MKKLLSILLAVAMLLSLSVTAFAAAPDITIHYVLTSDGKSSVTAKKGDVITVSYQIYADADASTITTQDEIFYDHSFFELVPGSIKLSDYYSLKYSTSTPVAGDGRHFVFFNSPDLLTYKTTAVEIGTFQLKVLASSGSSTIKNTSYFANDSSLHRFGAAATDLTVTVEAGSNTPGGGGGTVTPPVEPPVTIPVTGNEVKVEVTATVSGSTATVKDIPTSEISKVGRETISLDFSSMGKAVDEVKLPAASVETIAESASSGLEIKLSTGTVAFDAAAVEAISEAATGKDIALNVETVDKKELTSAQKSSVEGLGNAVIVKTTLTSGGKTISDFGGGSAAVTVPYAKKDAKAVVTVYYLDDSGKLTKMNATYNAATKTVTFIAPHFSEYVLAEVTALPFVDVDESAYYADAVRWAAANGITSGVDATHFAPMAITTRGQMVTFLWRAAGSPEPTETTCVFTDVKADAYYYKAVLWAVEAGITKGTSDTTFSPDANVSRGQTVTFLARMSGVKDDATGYSHNFADVYATDYFNNAVAWAATNKITEGTSATTFSPDDDCLRGQIVTFLYRNFVK